MSEYLRRVSRQVGATGDSLIADRDSKAKPAGSLVVTPSVGWTPSSGFDVQTNRRLGLLFPWLTGDHWLCLGPVLFFFCGHYRGSPEARDQIVYVAMLADGSQRTYTPADFAETFAWKNDPE